MDVHVFEGSTLPRHIKQIGQASATNGQNIDTRAPDGPQRRELTAPDAVNLRFNRAQQDHRMRPGRRVKDGGVKDDLIAVSRVDGRLAQRPRT